MESRMVKFYSKESNMVAIHAIPGHFATSHSHINYYIDITSLKTMLMCGKVTHNNLIGSSSPIPSARYSYF